MSVDPMPTNQRAANRRRTVAAIQDAALTLAEEHGWTATTSEQIARAAEISPRTFFRHSPTKVDAVASIGAEIEARVTATLREIGGPRTLPGVEAAIRTALRDTEREQPATLSQLLRVHSLIQTDAALRDALLERDARHVLHVSTQWGDDTADATLIVPVALLTLRIAIDDWASGSSDGPRPGLATVYDRHRARLRQVLAAG